MAPSTTVNSNNAHTKMVQVTSSKNAASTAAVSMFIRVTPKDLPHQNQTARLEEITVHLRRKGPNDALEKEQQDILLTLHERIIVVTDAAGVLWKFTGMPQSVRYPVPFGVQHVFDPDDWKIMGAIVRMETFVDDLLRTNTSGPDLEECVGCILKKFGTEWKDIKAYAKELKFNDTVNFIADDVRCCGYVTENIVSRRRVRVNVQVCSSTKGHYDWIMEEIPWVALKLPLYLLSSSGRNASPQYCACMVSAWRERQKKWFERFELRPTPTADGMGVFTKQDLPTGYPISDFIGVLKPYPKTVRKIKQPILLNAATLQKRNATVFTHPFESSPLNPRKYKSTEEIDSKPPHTAHHCIEFTTTSNHPKAPPSLTVDNYLYSNFSRFVRHSCDPNARRKEARCGSVKMNVLFAIKPILEGDQITEDLGVEYVKAAGTCDCESLKCHLRGGKKRKRVEEDEVVDEKELEEIVSA
ncbi:SET domain-containing protein [Amniculicola lignicola CBS 123094]|uniref:SET domain-containing protein n=1 Tax=Amniculicola lignicola CBS 123094 TaxID=1392246 RepID=A0A6A5W7Z1_9PLEO|nr:SET domain-containing protein [Amniculicola lignicola CBS 123094]